MEQRPGDVSWEEIATKIKIIFSVVALLIGAELFYRWLTQPDDTFSLYQELITLIWYNLHSLIFGPDSVTLASKNGLDTVLIFNHPSFEGSDINSLWVSDECVGIHEIAFVSFMIWMTPGVAKNLKIRGITAMALVLALLNIVRLLVLYPLAVNGCVDSPNNYGCWSPMWEFHEFMLQTGFMLLIILGWTTWFIFVGGPEKTRNLDLKSLFPFPKQIFFKKNLSNASIIILIIIAIISSSAIHTLGFDSQAKQEKIESDGCDGIISAKCAIEIKEWNDISGKAWRTLFVSSVTTAFVITKFDWGNITDEEE